MRSYDDWKLESPYEDEPDWAVIEEEWVSEGEEVAREIEELFEELRAMLPEEARDSDLMCIDSLSGLREVGFLRRKARDKKKSTALTAA